VAYRTLGLLPEASGYAETLRGFGFADDCVVLVAADQTGSGILGTITLEPFGPANELARDETEADIRAFAVVPQAQGQGVGRQLLLAVIECASERGVRRLRLCTRSAMTAAQHLYARTGFSRTPDLDFEPVPGITLRAYELALPSDPFPGQQPDKQPVSLSRALQVAPTRPACGKPAVMSAGNRYSTVRKTGTLVRVSDLYVRRIVDGLLDEMLLSFPAISLVGPRAAGKTTTVVRRGGTVLRMDRPEVRQSVAASPDAMLAGLRLPIILDEWQEVPELLGAVKRSVDQDPSPGRYILTGSVRAELENQVWPGTGRLLQVPMYGMSVREVLGRASLTPFIDRVIDGGPNTVTAPDDALSVRDYLDLMLAGSFPEPLLQVPAAARRRWFAGYIEQMITRDVPAVAPCRDPELLRRTRPLTRVIWPGFATRPAIDSLRASSCTPARGPDRSET
jgi:GNAT superfamily N-acetyltransferase